MVHRFGILALLGLCLLTAPSRLLAQPNDARLRIAITAENMQNARADTRQAGTRSTGIRLSNTKLALRLALPRLWDRIIPEDMRSQADAIAPSYGLVARIIPGEKQTTVEFDGKRVFRTLEKDHIPAIVTEPHFHLVLHVRNSAGLEMDQTDTLLMGVAEDFSPRWGIALADNTPGIIATWQWLDNEQVMLSLRGNSRLQEFSETRVITDADPLPQLSAWLREVLLKARDAYASDVKNVESSHHASPEVEQQFILTIDRKTPLIAQVALEDALGDDSRVHRMLPLSLSSTRQRYLLVLKGIDNSWLTEWFKRRGYLLTALPEGGWIAQ